jgi:hypothetical protein
MSRIIRALLVGDGPSVRAKQVDITHSGMTSCYIVI